MLKKRAFLESCRNITIRLPCRAGFLCRAIFRGCAEIEFFGDIFTSELITRDFQRKFKDRVGIRAFYPEPQLGGNSNTGNVPRRFFQAAAISADILGIPEELISTFWELLVAINSTNFQDIQQYETKAKEAFNLWRQVFPKVMILIATC